MMTWGEDLGEKGGLLFYVQSRDSIDDYGDTRCLLPSVSPCTLRGVQGGWRHFKAARRKGKDQAMCEQANQLFDDVCYAFDRGRLRGSEYRYFKEKIKRAAKRKSCKLS
ncbi:hypothetical protein B0T14DRAFT_501974 [Immersiella caudata]|uniref:Uncharacterized protein n=1 Tax=Immersiella caudata TaxID=314043 RepID=A0AA39XCV3_9PEZI|nr:hypothetical protein B0T14DRAFT_501974 [Immersiella caudata]